MGMDKTNAMTHGTIWQFLAQDHAALAFWSVSGRAAALRS
jgi:hypothetical protein